jgi:hypothetical protein
MPASQPVWIFTEARRAAREVEYALRAQVAMRSMYGNQPLGGHKLDREETPLRSTRSRACAIAMRGCPNFSERNAGHAAERADAVVQCQSVHRQPAIVLGHSRLGPCPPRGDHGARQRLRLGGSRRPCSDQPAPVRVVRVINVGAERSGHGKG